MSHLGGHENRYAAWLTCNTPHGIARVWPQPGKEPLVMIDRTVLVTVHDQPTVLAAIGPRVLRHGLQMSAPTAPFGAIVLVDVFQRLPSQNAFVL